MLKKTSLVFFFLLATALVNVMLPIKAQTLVAINKNQPRKVAVAESDVLQKYADVSALSLPERRGFFRNASANDKSSLWKIHMALYLVKRPELRNEQKQVILDAMSLASPELFEVPMTDPAQRAKANEPLQLLTKRSLEVFPKNEAAEFLGNMGGGQAETELLQKYKKISDLSKQNRKSSFNAASAIDKSDLWKVHLALYLAKHSELNKEQKEVILEAIALATPELYGTSAKSSEQKAEVDEPLQLLTKRAHEVFSKEEGAEVFDNLGGAESPSSLNLLEPEVTTMRRDCGCSHASDWCFNDCFGTGCNQSASGCGT